MGHITVVFGATQMSYSLSFRGLELHHGTEIPNKDVYVHLEQAGFRGLGVYVGD